MPLKSEEIRELRRIRGKGKKRLPTVTRQGYLAPGAWEEIVGRRLRSEKFQGRTTSRKPVRDFIRRNFPRLYRMIYR